MAVSALVVLALSWKVTLAGLAFLSWWQQVGVCAVFLLAGMVFASCASECLSGELLGDRGCLRGALCGRLFSWASFVALFGLAVVVDPTLGFHLPVLKAVAIFGILPFYAMGVAPEG
jgi:hypothetical protein